LERNGLLQYSEAINEGRLTLHELEQHGAGDQSLEVGEEGSPAFVEGHLWGFTEEEEEVIPNLRGKFSDPVAKSASVDMVLKQEGSMSGTAGEKDVHAGADTDCVDGDGIKGGGGGGGGVGVGEGVGEGEGVGDGEGVGEGEGEGCGGREEKKTPRTPSRWSWFWGEEDEEKSETVVGQEGVGEEGGKEVEQEAKEVEEEGKEVEAKSACVDQLMEQEKGKSRQAGEDSIHASLAEEIVGHKVKGPTGEEEDTLAELMPVRKILNFGSADIETHELTKNHEPIKENMQASADKSLRAGCAAAAFSVASKIGDDIRELIAEVETAVTPGD